MESESAELQKLVRENTKLVRETHEMVHQMRRNARIANAFRIFYWLVIIGAVGASYFLYFGPLFDRLHDLLINFQAASDPQNVQQAFVEFLQHLISGGN